MDIDRTFLEKMPPAYAFFTECTMEQIDFNSDNDLQRAVAIAAKYGFNCSKGNVKAQYELCLKRVNAINNMLEGTLD